jgi:hypothetical protein
VPLSDVDDLFEEMILEETGKRILRALERRSDSIPRLYEESLLQIMSKGRITAAFDAWEERKAELFRKEMRSMASRKRQGLPYYEDDDIIDTSADVIDDETTDEDSNLSP